MQREVAAEIVALMLEYWDKLNASVQSVKDTCSRQEFLAYRKAVSIIMGKMRIGIMQPIFNEHPDLEPETMKPRK
jgi:hypothetical protein